MSAGDGPGGEGSTMRGPRVPGGANPRGAGRGGRGGNMHTLVSSGFLKKIDSWEIRHQVAIFSRHVEGFPTTSAPPTFQKSVALSDGGNTAWYLHAALVWPAMAI